MSSSASAIDGILDPLAHSKIMVWSIDSTGEIVNQ